MHIKSIYDTVLFTSAALSIKDALVEAVAKKANLEGAYLGGAYLEGANLRGANLEGANLRGANLRGANLEGANLGGAYLGGAYLEGANLRGAYLEGANLRGADLRGAYLGGAFLRGAYLGGAYLEGANLEGAYLGGAYLEGANLRGANLEGANLRGANLRDAQNIPTIALARLQFIPTEGAFIGWKKCRDGKIVKLGISASAKRSHGADRKCRCSKAKVLTIFLPDGSACEEAASMRDPDFVYRVGMVVTPDTFDDNRWNTCGAGIHFYITREEAEAHQ